MVRKTSHRGVHSGNTLRASNSRYSRRYHTHACIVSTVRPELLKKLQEHDALVAKNTDGCKPAEPVNNVAVGVALSLNKQARWSLPSTLIQQIQTDDIADGELTVSVLERHKLRRPDNCVSFHTNKGDIRRVQPKNGRYVGFIFPRTDRKSRRALRKERREKMQEVLKENNMKDVNGGKMVQVFTEQGKGDIGESEVRYEVYYPAPASCSLAHNPKYIRPGDLHNSQSGLDIPQHVQHGKPRKTHSARRRHRMTLKDIDDWELASCPSPTLTTLPCMLNPQQFSTLLEVPEECSNNSNSMEFMLSALIEKATQKLRNCKGSLAVKTQNKRNRACVKEGDDDKKPHIVYINESKENSGASQKSEVKSEKSPATANPAPVSPMPLEHTRVVLPKDDVTEGSLRERFGEGYTEVGCQPRKLVLDVTGSVRQLLKKHGVQAKVAEQTEQALTYLVCVHDGFYDDDRDVYRVLVNSSLHEGGLLPVKMPEVQGLWRGTVMDLVTLCVDGLQGLVTSLRDSKHFPLFVHDKPVRRPHLSNHLGSSEAYVPSVQWRMQSGAGSAASSLSPSTWEVLGEEPVFCEVCYDDINPLTHDSVSSTALVSCRHHVCDACWSQHILTRWREGFVRVTCPGYDCQHDAPLCLLLSLAPLTTVQKLLIRQEEVRIGGSPTEEWCPNQACGRVISLNTPPSPGEPQLQQDVVCACGVHVCFQCLMPAHWPSSCQQAEVYRAMDTARLPDRLAEIHDDYQAEILARERQVMEKKKSMLVQGKHCPACKNFVFKDGGCPQMSCRCGQLFCWKCGQPGIAHYVCTKMLTTTIVVHHFDREENPEDTKQQQPSSRQRRRRTSLMERAVEHRKHRENSTNFRAISNLAKAAAAAAVKDRGLRQQLITACCSKAFPSKPLFLEATLTFLRNADGSRQELLEVVEHSLVLLKDLPDSLLRRRALRTTEDLSAFCSFSQSVLDVWGKPQASHASLQQAVKAVERLAEIQRWINAVLDTHVVTVRKLRGLASSLSSTQ